MLSAFLNATTQRLKPALNLYGQVRTATKRVSGSGGRSGGTAGKRLGVKKFSDELVIPGNIIVRQRGSHFHPGQHVKMGRDHTIYSIAPGFVRFYVRKFGLRDRRYVGVVLNRGETLPRNEAALGRSRYFGFVELNGVERPTVVNRA
ncbi:ribosomal L27 protein-domain-containing protein [Auriculariales sp. MPI-PUGE-AT-0066]|nr:ribosomal L27 protein-domain-containing protein [Auriculariales sp. MPI-PUGE-AT-0066]